MTLRTQPELPQLKIDDLHREADHGRLVHEARAMARPGATITARLAERIARLARVLEPRSPRPLPRRSRQVGS